MSAYPSPFTNTVPVTAAVVDSPTYPQQQQQQQPVQGQVVPGLPMMGQMMMMPMAPGPSGSPAMPNQVIVVHIGPNGQYYLPPAAATAQALQLQLQQQQPNRFTPEEQDQIFEVVRTANWVKIYFIFGMILITINAFFSTLWWILAALAPAVVAYIGVRTYNVVVMTWGSIYWLCVLALRIVAIVAIYTWDKHEREGDALAMAVSTGAGALGICIDCYFCFKYVAIIQSLNEMSGAQKAELATFEPGVCGCL